MVTTDSVPAHKEAIRDGWYQVITVFPAQLTTVAYRYESGGWWIPDPEFNEASLVGADVTPLYTEAELSSLLATTRADGQREAVEWYEHELDDPELAHEHRLAREHFGVAVVSIWGSETTEGNNSRAVVPLTTEETEHG